MPQISRTTNPTGLKRLDKKDILVRVQTKPSGVRSFWLEKLDHTSSGLEDGLCVACIAHAGNTEEFFRLGSTGRLDHGAKELHELATDRPLRFRFILHKPDSAKLIAFADGIRSIDESGFLQGSLVDIEPVELHGPSWKLEIPDSTGTDKPVLMVDRHLFPTAQAAANNVWVSVLVMPEVMRQIAQFIVDHSDSLDDSGSWVQTWEEYLRALGVLPPDQDADEFTKAAWVSEVVSAFCAKSTLKSQMGMAVEELSGGQ